VCHQSVGLIARHAEANGISTVCLSSALDITQSVNPPRAVFLDFPLGHTSGKANDSVLQFSIVRDALMALEDMKVPGSIKILSYKWREDESWMSQESLSDSRLPRFSEPQFQCEDDRILYERGRFS
jgi:hypothetical protein